MVELRLPKTQIAATFGVSRQTLYTALRKAAPPTDAARAAD
jgi:DNA-binding phage protein